VALPPFEKSSDVVQPTRASVPRTLAGIGAALAGNGVNIDDVGDSDSFGRHMTYLGLRQSTAIILTPDCTEVPADQGRCITITPPGTADFYEANLGIIRLPAKATRSLLCFTFTPFIGVNFQNDGATPATAQFRASGLIGIENAVLKDPTLIDPATGMPFDGRLESAIGQYSETHTLAPGAIDQKSIAFSRACGSGLVSTTYLMDLGLSEAQAREFFKNPMTIHFAAHGSVSLATGVQYFYAVRLYGD
jgi:hypothetical protein